MSPHDSPSLARSLARSLAHSHHAILVTHSYLNATTRARSAAAPRGAARPDGSNAVGGAEGEAVFDALVRPHPHVFLVLCGHDDGVGYLVARDGATGRPVHQVLSNYQQWPRGGDGWLRVLGFRPSRDELSLRSFNVLTQRYNRSARLVLPHCMSGGAGCAAERRADAPSQWYGSSEVEGGVASLTLEVSSVFLGTRFAPPCLSPGAPRRRVLPRSHQAAWGHRRSGSVGSFLQAPEC